ncbi:MAG TPA: SRPBCC domain-containing protein [Gaiellaceae bacterium]|nr:SRPBCC domain-containing protein [Gaiellaceae bacterium]
MTDASLLTDRTRPAMRLERHLPDPPTVVWLALTEREQLHSWFPSDVIVEGGRWEVGAAITFPFPPDVIDMTLTGEVLEVDEPNLLAFTWGEDTLRFELSPEQGGTRLVLVDELPAGSAARNAAGWEICLDRLAGLEPASDAWQPRFERYAAAFEPALGPQEGRQDGAREEGER